MLKSALLEPVFNKQAREYCKSKINDRMELYKQGYITLEEYLESVSEFEELYKRCITVKKQLINSTLPYSEERYELLGYLY